MINTGDNTIIGQIANLAATASASKSPLRIELDRFIAIISVISIIMGIFFFLMGVMLDYPFITCLIFGIGIIVANVPEGLLATVTVALSLTAQKLYHKKVLVKNIEAVETLGSTSCICSDKTGTLTENKMTVKHLWYSMRHYEGANMQKINRANDFGKDEDNYVKLEYDHTDPTFLELHRIAVCASEAKFNRAVTTDAITRANLPKIPDPPLPVGSEGGNGGK